MEKNMKDVVKEKYTEIAVANNNGAFWNQRRGYSS